MLLATGMMLSVLLQLLAFAAAQSTVSTSSTSESPDEYATPTGTATTSSDEYASTTGSGSATTGSGVTHTIDVAKGGFTFVPDVTLANVGDYIEFNFYPTNHSVVRAEYGYPCIPYEDTGVNKFGFFSGFRPVDTIISEPPTFTVEINDTNPVFFYCSAPGSCIGYGMVGVINPNATTSLVKQRQLAKDSTFMLQPGEAWPSEGGADPFTTTAATTTSTPTSSSTTTPTAAPAKSSSLSGGAIAGIAIGAAAVVLIAAALLFVCGRRSRRRRTTPDTVVPQTQTQTFNQPPPQPPYSPQMGQMGTFGYAPPQSPVAQQPYQYAYPPSPAFGYAPQSMPHMSEHKSAAMAAEADVGTPTFGGTQRFSSPPPGYVPPHDPHREAAASPIHEM